MSYIKGEVSYQVYFNKDNNYGVYKVQFEETNEPLLDFKTTCTISGYFADLEVGTSYTFNGSMKLNTKYGYSFVVETYERILPTSKEGIVSFLSSDAFKGIGRKTAQTIVDALGEEAINLILEDKNILNKVPSLNERKREIIYDSLVANRDIENTLVTLYSYGLTPKMAMRIYKFYEQYTLDVVKTTPYKLIEDVEGIGFNRADKIALKSGIHPKSEMRVESCLLYCLQEEANETGNTYMYKSDLISRTISYLGFYLEDRDLIERSIDNLVAKQKVFAQNDEISAWSIYNAEKYIAYKLKKINSKRYTSFHKDEITNLIHSFEETQHLTYEDEQVEAILSAIINNVSIITGGPGTGKTTIVKGILSVYRQIIESNAEYIKLCAPTGKAAKRIEESTNYESKTIHRLLGYDVNGHFTYNRYNILDARLVIVDETSMVDTFLFDRLLDALRDDVKIVIVGDYDQLPSIGPGQVLKDIIDSNAFKVTRLKKIHRQKENSKIISLAYDILDGAIKTELDESHDELSFIPCDREDFLEVLRNTVQHFMNLGYSLHNDIQVLIPIYKSPVGIEVVNKYLQGELNSNYNFEGNIDGNTFFLDDKVIQLVNQYEDGVMNGDMGVVTDCTNNELKVDFQGTNVVYKGMDIYNIQLAYAISIHKAQGSEFPVVILPIFSNYNILLNRKLIYTAVTRAKENLIIIGQNGPLTHGITVSSKDRLTKLKSFL